VSTREVEWRGRFADGWTPEQVLPGVEPMPLWLTDDAGMGLRDTMGFFDPMGRPLPGGRMGSVMLFEQLRNLPENHLVTDLHAGMHMLQVSTVYLGLNHNYREGYPLVWETMIFPDDHKLEVWCHRYAHRPAAVLGHGQVVVELVTLGCTVEPAGLTDGR
jgi:hypothetical protein